MASAVAAFVIEPSDLIVGEGYWHKGKNEEVTYLGPSHGGNYLFKSGKFTFPISAHYVHIMVEKKKDPISYVPQSPAPYSQKVRDAIIAKTKEVRAEGRNSLNKQDSPILYAVFPEMFEYQFSHGGTTSLPGKVTACALREIAAERMSEFSRVSSVSIMEDGESFDKEMPYISKAVDMDGKVYFIMVRSGSPNSGQIKEWTKVAETLQKEDPQATVMLVPNEYSSKIKLPFTHSLQDVFKVVSGGNADTYYHFMQDVQSAI